MRKERAEMAADLYIHVATGINQEDLRCLFSNSLGSRYFAPGGGCDDFACVHHNRIARSPRIHIGEVSWLKVALLEDEESFIPGPVESVAALFDDTENTPSY